MTAEEQLQQGLRDFARGEFERAARTWLRALEAHPHDAHLRQFVEAILAIDPSLGRAVPLAPLQPVDAEEPWGEPCAAPPATVSSDAPGLAALQAGSAATGRVGPAASAQAIATLQARLKERWDLHDFTGCLEVAEALLKVAPGYAQALRARTACREHLTRMYESKLGALTATPHLRVRPDELPWLDLDQRDGFVLSQVDGVSSYAEILEITGLDRLEALALLARLVTKRVIGVV
jgi:hypothetical protein